MCDDFLAIKIVILFIQNSDIPVQSKMFLLKLKNYEDWKLLLEEERAGRNPPMKYMLFSITFLPLPLISKISITAVTEQPEVQITFSFISEVLKRLNTLQIG